MALKSAVVGAGVIALQHLPYLAESNRSDLVAVCDLSAAGSRLIGRKFAARSTYTDVSEMLATEKPDVVHVLTPPHTHGFLVKMCLEAGAHVICEKPLAPTAAEARELFTAADTAGRHLVEVHNYRFNDGVVELAKLVDQGTLGSVREVEVRIGLAVRGEGSKFADLSNPSPIHQMPAGVIHDVATHMAYILNGLAGNPKWDTSSSVWNNHGGGDLFTVDDLDSLLVAETRDGPVHGRVRFSANLSPDEFSIRVWGTKGRAATDLFHPHLEVSIERPVGDQLTPIANHVVNGFSLMKHGVSNFGQKLLQHTPYHGLARFLDETYAGFQAGDCGPVKRSDVLGAAELIDLLVADRNRKED